MSFKFKPLSFGDVKVGETILVSTNGLTNISQDITVASFIKTKLKARKDDSGKLRSDSFTNADPLDPSDAPCFVVDLALVEVVTE